MISYAWESIDDLLQDPDFLPLIESQSDELRHYQDVPLDPDWDRYRELESAGKFYAYVARRNGMLIGYLSVFVDRHINYKSSAFAWINVVYVHPEERQSGELVGNRMHEAVEAKMRELRVSLLHGHDKSGTRGLKIWYLRLGYEPYEGVYAKAL